MERRRSVRASKVGSRAIDPAASMNVDGKTSLATDTLKCPCCLLGGFTSRSDLRSHTMQCTRKYLSNRARRNAPTPGRASSSFMSSS
eukprot:1648195-Prorocentrum_lima.AAC.1